MNGKNQNKMNTTTGRRRVMKMDKNTVMKRVQATTNNKAITRKGVPSRAEGRRRRGGRGKKGSMNQKQAPKKEVTADQLDNELNKYWEKVRSIDCLYVIG